MVMLAEQYDFVIGGDPDRDTVDLAVLDTGVGRVHAHLAEAADGAGYRRMLGCAVAGTPLTCGNTATSPSQPSKLAMPVRSRSPAPSHTDVLNSRVEDVRRPDGHRHRDGPASRGSRPSSEAFKILGMRTSATSAMIAAAPAAAAATYLSVYQTGS